MSKNQPKINRRFYTIEPAVIFMQKKSENGLRNFFSYIIFGILVWAGCATASENADQTLYDGIIANSIDLVNSGIQKGAYLNKRYTNGETPLTTAAERNASPQIIKALVNGGANISAQNDLGETALHKALNFAAREENIILLINYGSDINFPTSFTKTPLIYALQNRLSYKIINDLISSGADANLPTIINQQEIYPLAIAVMQDLPDETISLLLRHSNQDAAFQALMAATVAQNGRIQKIYAQNGRIEMIAE